MSHLFGSGFAFTDLQIFQTVEQFLAEKLLAYCFCLTVDAEDSHLLIKRRSKNNVHPLTFLAALKVLATGEFLLNCLGEVNPYFAQNCQRSQNLICSHTFAASQYFLMKKSLQKYAATIAPHENVIFVPSLNQILDLPPLLLSKSPCEFHVFIILLHCIYHQRFKQQ